MGCYRVSGMAGKILRQTRVHIYVEAGVTNLCTLFYKCYPYHTYCTCGLYPVPPAKWGLGELIDWLMPYQHARTHDPHTARPSAPSAPLRSNYCVHTYHNQTSHSTLLFEGERNLLRP